jgi:hypothetical protein
MTFGTTLVYSRLL